MVGPVITFMGKLYLLLLWLVDLLHLWLKAITFMVNFYYIYGCYYIYGFYYIYG